MRKEVILAIVIGFALGLVITFGIWTANKALTKNKIQTSQQETTAQANIVTPTPSFFLDISSPEDQSLSNDAKITLSGKTQPGATIVVAYENGEDVVDADENGAFASNITLVAGTNEITVTAFDTDGNQVSKTINVVYSTTQI